MLGIYNLLRHQDLNIMSNGNNKTNKTHRDLLKNAKRNSDGLNYNTQPSVSDSSSRGNMNVTVDKVDLNKPKKNPLDSIPKPTTTKEGGSGYVYDPVKKRVDAAAQANPLVRLFKGIKPMNT